MTEEVDTEPTRQRARIGLVADPDFPQIVAEYLAEHLPGALGDERAWEVAVEVDPVAAGQRDVADTLRAMVDRTSHGDWDYAVCLTDLPLRREGRPVLAEVDRGEGVAVVALPSLGGFQPRRRARQLVVQIIDELATIESEDDERAAQHGLQSTLTRLLAPIHRTESTTDDGAVDIRYSATRGRGRLRLLTGMVRTNRPWRLLLGMSRALAAAVATSVFGLSSSTIWQIAGELDPVRKVSAAVLSVVVLVIWLIAAHRLWEKTSAGTGPHARGLVWLYNASTVLTLTIGVSCMYVGLFVVNLGIAGLLVPSPLLAGSIGGAVGPGSYLALAWGFTTMGVVAGALGSSLESDNAVRQAAYGYRERQRRAQRERQDEGSHD